MCNSRGAQELSYLRGNAMYGYEKFFFCHPKHVETQKQKM